MIERSPRTPIFKSKTRFDFLPDWTANDSWLVHKYRIDPDYQPPPIKRTIKSDFSYNFWDLELDVLEINNQTSTNITFDRGKYIIWDPRSTPTSYRISDHPNIFVEFAAIGKEIKPEEKKVKKFIDRYGIPRVRLDPLIDGTDYTFGQNGFYSFDTFCDYANEAYYALNLYEALTTKNVRSLRETMLKGLDFNCLGGLFSEVFDFGKLMNIPDYIKHKYLANWDQTKLDKRTKLEVEYLSWDPWELFLYYGTNSQEEFNEFWLNVWTDYINEVTPEYITELSAEAIEFIVHHRLSESVGCGITKVSPKENGLGVYTFEDSWGGHNLLSKMWFTFYLKITGKLKHEYKICPVCNEPIIPEEGKKLRKNTEYHHNCRQTGHNRKVREVQKLWKEGESLKEIVIITGVKEERVKAWVEKVE